MVLAGATGPTEIRIPLRGEERRVYRPGAALRLSGSGWAALRRLGLGAAIVLAGLDLVVSNRVPETRADREWPSAVLSMPSTRGELRALGRVRRMPASYDTGRIPMEGAGWESWLDVGS